MTTSVQFFFFKVRTVRPEVLIPLSLISILKLYQTYPKVYWV